MYERLKKIVESVENISALSDTPSLSPTDLKKEFDKGNKIIKEYFNDLVADILKIFGFDINTFSETLTYKVGDLAVCDRMLWECHTEIETPGSWTGAANWKESAIFENVAD